MTSVSVAKHSYIKAGPDAKGKAKAHVRYIQHRGGHDKEQGPRQFFDKEDDRVSAKSIREEIDAAGDRGVVIHKFILSPGVQGVDLQRYTREVMEELGDRKGLDLDWKAVIHKNTDHDHVHVVVMGRDRDGRTVRFDRNDHQGMREVGDRYLERHHEFDRYFDRTLDNVMKEGGTRGLDLDSLFKPYDRSGEDKGKRKKKQTRTDRELHEKTEFTKLPARRKPRRQRAFEARGRNERDYFHDLYQRQTARQELEQRIQSNPENSAYYKEQLAFLDRVDADRRQDIMARSAELNRVLGIEPTKQKERAKQSETQASDSDTESTPDHPPEPQPLKAEEERIPQEAEVEQQRPVTPDAEKLVEELTGKDMQAQNEEELETANSQTEGSDLVDEVEAELKRLEEDLRKVEELERKVREEEERDR